MTYVLLNTSSGRGVQLEFYHARDGGQHRTPNDDLDLGQMCMCIGAAARVVGGGR